MPGVVARGFAYSPAEPFAAGRHRGVDLAARPGETVRAPCAGAVAYAGRGVVTLRCGPWRVTHLPLATLTVRAGARVREGARLGTLAASREHQGLHLGVRRAGDRFAYVDPLPFLPSDVPRVGPPAASRGRAARAPGAAPTAPGAAPTVPGAAPTVPEAAPTAPGAAPAVPGTAPHAPAHPRVFAPARPLVAPPARAGVRVRELAPWPVWLGLALVLAGAVGGGVSLRVRRRRARVVSALSRT